ncbi:MULTISPECIES: hypothetical protein [unclassified Bradyrhizobium]|uniref:hypothetical protein n=1 Tax=unclassified Bradyrhizobium TaxID=2631580 RepID=UPI0028F082EA|nr:MULTISPECIES: hypothetical protein [unclassified Bradyrhizobium]
MENSNTETDAALRKRLDWLLRDLCVDWGFCSRLTADDLMLDGQPPSPQAFAAAVLRAEGMNAEYEPDWRRRIEQMFVARLTR